MAFNRNQIKKILYKEKPIASLVWHGDSGCLHYTCNTSVGEFKFKIPKKEASPNLMLDEPAQLLIRWLDIE